MTGGEGAGGGRRSRGCSLGVPDPSKTVIHCAKFDIRPLRGARGARRGARGARGRVSERKVIRKNEKKRHRVAFLKVFKAKFEREH